MGVTSRPATGWSKKKKTSFLPTFFRATVRCLDEPAVGYRNINVSESCIDVQTNCKHSKVDELVSENGSRLGHLAAHAQYAVHLHGAEKKDLRVRRGEEAPRRWA